MIPSKNENILIVSSALLSILSLTFSRLGFLPFLFYFTFLKLF